MLGYPIAVCTFWSRNEFHKGFFYMYFNFFSERNSFSQTTKKGAIYFNLSFPFLAAFVVS